MDGEGEGHRVAVVWAERPRCGGHRTGFTMGRVRAPDMPKL
jgi:hypothetical protein